MKNRQLYSYLAEVTTADLTITPPGFTFNNSCSVAEYFNKVVHKEIQFTLRLNNILSEAESRTNVNNFLMPYIRSVEDMFQLSEAGFYTHRHLRIIDPSADFMPDETQISQFVEIQFASLLRIKTILSDRSQPTQLSYQFNDSQTDLLELLNILFETQAITPAGTNTTKSAFITAAFRFFNITLPLSFFQQIAQTTRRHNPTKYLDELKRKYNRFLSDHTGK